MGAPHKDDAVFSAFKLLFMHPDDAGRPVVRANLIHAVFLSRLAAVLTGTEGGATAEDYWNDLASAHPGRTLSELLEECFFEVLAEAGALAEPAGETAQFLLLRAERLQAYVAALAQGAHMDELTPAARAFLAPSRDKKPLAERVWSRDPFGAGRTFAYRAGRFRPIELPDIRNVGEFFGYEGPRRHFAEAMEDFSKGLGNVTLLVSSLPGHGKTQMVIANVLAHENLTMVLPEPDALEGDLVGLIGALALRKDRKFVLFFDDIVPDKVDFYAFRTHVGGAFTLPGNILIVLASNYPFPPSIVSRGRSVAFPTFDDVKCLEMVDDFLVSSGMRHPKENLALLIAADYTEDFGQKKFPELSPRTLVRYLERYRCDPVKRRTMLALSEGEMITKPDSQLFYEFNVQLMRKLYGNEYIENLLKEKLRTLGE